MARVIISHLGLMQDTEIRFLCTLALEFEQRGHQPIIWSSGYSRGDLAPYHLPHDWRLKRLPEFYSDLRRDLDEGYALTDRKKWAARVARLVKQDWGQSSREQLLDNLVSMSYQVIDTLKPDLFLSWNTLSPHAGIAYDMCRQRGIPACLIEFGVFPDTWFIERGGLVGHSVLAGVDAEQLIPAERREHYREIGRDYLDRTSFGKYNRYAQVQESEMMQRLLQEPLASRRPRVAFFPPDDGSLGFVPADGPDRKASIPGYESSFEAAKALSKAHDGITLFKPHPSFLEKSFDTSGYPSLYVVDYDFRKVIEWSDVVASTGSGLEFVAMSMNRPVLLQANDLLAGKGVAYEAQHPHEIEAAVEAAYNRDAFEERYHRFLEFTGYLITEYLINPADAPQGYRKPANAVEELCQEHLEGKEGHPDRREFWDTRLSLLTPGWTKELSRDTELAVASSRVKKQSPSGDKKDELFAMLRKGAYSHVVLDFDHGLFLDNSTECFLNSVRPRALAFFIVQLSDALVSLCALYKTWRYELWRDYVRILFVSMFLPWSTLWWRVTARRRMSEMANHELLDAVAAGKPDQVIVISFGMRHVIQPLLAALPLKTRLLSSSVDLRLTNLRRTGRMTALLPHVPPEELDRTIFVTDSEDD